MRAVFADGNPIGLEYFIACDSCGKHLTKERYTYYFLSSLHEIELYSLKILLGGAKGWIEENLWRRIVLGRKMAALEGFESARRLRERVSLPPNLLEPLAATP